MYQKPKGFGQCKYGITGEMRLFFFHLSKDCNFNLTLLKKIQGKEKAKLDTQTKKMARKARYILDLRGRFRGWQIAWYLKKSIFCCKNCHCKVARVHNRNAGMLESRIRIFPSPEYNKLHSRYFFLKVIYCILISSAFDCCTQNLESSMNGPIV